MTEVDGGEMDRVRQKVNKTRFKVTEMEVEQGVTQNECVLFMVWVRGKKSV